jgi:hypothetical protein
MTAFVLEQVKKSFISKTGPVLKGVNVPFVLTCHNTNTFLLFNYMYGFPFRMGLTGGMCMLMRSLIVKNRLTVSPRYPENAWSTLHKAFTKGITELSHFQAPQCCKPFLANATNGRRLPKSKVLRKWTHKLNERNGVDVGNSSGYLIVMLLRGASLSVPILSIYSDVLQSLHVFTVNMSRIRSQWMTILSLVGHWFPGANITGTYSPPK